MVIIVFVLTIDMDKICQDMQSQSVSCLTSRRISQTATPGERHPQVSLSQLPECSISWQAAWVASLPASLAAEEAAWCMPLPQELDYI